MNVLEVEKQSFFVAENVSLLGKLQPPSLGFMMNTIIDVDFDQTFFAWQNKTCPEQRENHFTKGRLFHTMDMLWEKFQWILPLYMKPISFQSKASVVCSVTTTVFIDFCLKKLNVFSQHIGKKQMNIWIPQNKSPGIEMLINFLC